MEGTEARETESHLELQGKPEQDQDDPIGHTDEVFFFPGELFLTETYEAEGQGDGEGGDMEKRTPPKRKDKKTDKAVNEVNKRKDKMVSGCCGSRLYQ